jgi:AcrR family transcriptional regulator
LGTRDRILDAAAHVMRTRGLARATTKEIARAAGYSEPTLYKHFTDKPDLFLAVLHERMPSFSSFMKVLAAEEVPGTLRDWLDATARAAIAFYEESFPVSASMFSEPDLLAAHRAGAVRSGGGPQRPIEAVAGYLRAEQQRGRVRPEADCDAAAAMLIGACFQYAFIRSFFGQPADSVAVTAYAGSVADTLAVALAPS